MQAANEGELLGDVSNRTYSIGLNVELPHEQAPNPFVEVLYHHGTFFSRLHHFVQLSSAFVVMRGGIGTTLEALMVWQLCQVGHLKRRPLIMVGGMWPELVDWGRKHWLSADGNLADPEDLEIPVCVETVDEAVRLIHSNLEDWAADAS
jgi:predicted Rossmann-fold nucleotide-binding protein